MPKSAWPNPGLRLRMVKAYRSPKPLQALGKKVLLGASCETQQKPNNERTLSKDSFNFWKRLRPRQSMKKQEPTTVSPETESCSALPRLKGFCFGSGFWFLVLGDLI